MLITRSGLGFALGIASSLLIGCAGGSDEATNPGGGPLSLVGSGPSVGRAESAQLLQSAMFAFYEHDGAIEGGWRTHHATVRGGAIELTPYTFDNGERTAHAPISVATSAISVDQSTIASGPSVGSVVNGRIVMPRGAAVESLHNDIDGLHQEWAFASSPGTGDLDVDLAVSGYAYAGTTIGGVHFAGDGAMVRYSHAVWSGADGRAWPINTTFDEASGHIHLTVPAAVMAKTSFPALLDPTISAEVAADNPVIAPTGSTQQQQAIAFGAGEYLAVWSDNRDSSNADIWGARVSTDGSVLDTIGIQVAATTGIQSNPAVTYDGTQFVVAWEDFQTVNGTVSNIKVAHVSTAGAVTAVGAVASTAGSQTTPNLASAGAGSSLLVWNTAGEVDSTVVSGSVGATLAIATGALVERPSVASNPAGDYFVGYTVTNHLLGQLVTAAGALDGTAITVSAPTTGAQSQSDATYDGTNYDVVWKNGQNALVFGSRVSTTGTVLDTRMVGATTVGGIALNASPAQSFRPTISCQSSGCMLAWHDQRNNATTSFDLYGQLLTLAFVKSGTEIAISTAPGPQNFPRLASSGSGFELVWTDNRANASTQIFGATVSSAGAIGTAADIATSDNRESAITIGTAGTDSALFWRDSRGGPSTYYVRYDASGTALDATGQPVQAAATGAQNDPAASADLGGHTLVVWSDTRNGALKDIYGARVDLTAGTTLDASGIAISTAANNQLVPAVASNGTVALVVWQDSRNGAFDVYGALVDTTGTVTLNDIAIGTGAGNQDDPAVTYDTASGQFIVLWQDDASGTFQIKGARVSTAGALLDATPVAIVGSASAQQLPAAVSSATGTLAAWQDGAHVRGARLAGGATLSVTDVAGIAISSTSSNQGGPKVGVLGTSYVVVWNDDRAGNQDIYGQMVGTDGALKGVNFAISAAAYDEVSPQVIATSASTARVAYEAHTLDTSRAESRVLTNAIESIVVTPANPSIALGSSQQFTATATFSDGTTGDVTGSVVWSSSDNTIATISVGGLATGVAAGGPVTITATAGAVSGSTTLTVTGKVLTSIAVTPANATLPNGFTQQYDATGTYSDMSTANITASVLWSSSVTGVATITPAGVATMHASSGSTTITATLGGIMGSTTLSGNALTLVSIAVTPNPTTLNPTKTKQLVATGTFSDMSTLNITTQCSWSSSNTVSVTVGSRGIVTAVALGSSTITATKGAIMGTAIVNVVPPTLTSITVTPTNQLIVKTGTVTYTATGHFSDGSTQDLTGTAVWTSSKTTVATMAANVATGVGAGATTITATSGGIQGSTPLTVSTAALTSITIAPATMNLPIGFSAQLAATGHFADGSTANLTSIAVWTTSSAGAVTVTDGKVTAVSAAPATITATSNGVMGTAVVTGDTATLVSISVTPATNTVTVGHTKALVATGTFSDTSTLVITTQVVWSSSNAAIATVGTAGVVTAVASGGATIRATNGAVMGTATVTVP